MEHRMEWPMIKTHIICLPFIWESMLVYFFLIAQNCKKDWAKCKMTVETNDIFASFSDSNINT